jgi:hypothetical protein
MSNSKDSVLLNITSSGLGVNGPSHDFNINFSNLALNHDSRTRHEIALVSYSLWYSWYNVSADLGNNIFKYNNGTTARVITIDDGQYGVSDLNSYIKAAITAFGDVADNIKIVGNYNSLKVDLTIVGSYSVTFDGTGLDTILGFTEGVFIAGTWSSMLVPNITNGIDAIQIHSSLVSPSSNLINNDQSTCLHQFTPQNGPGANLSAEIQSLIYLPMTNLGSIHFASFSIKDNLGRTLDLNGEAVSLVFHIREH